MEIKKKILGLRKSSQWNRENAFCRKLKVELEPPKSMRKVRIIVNDPEATDSSDDDECVFYEKKAKRFICEFSYPIDDTIPKPESCKPVIKPKKKKFVPLMQSKPDPVTGKYRGVRQRAPGKWAAEIRDPFKRKRVWLGTFPSEQAASHAYEQKRLEFELMAEGISDFSPHEESSVQEDHCSNKTKILTKQNKVAAISSSEDSSNGSSVSLPLRKSPLSVLRTNSVTSDLGNNDKCKEIMETECHKPLEDSMINDDELLALAQIGGEFDLDLTLDSIVIDETFAEPLDNLFCGIGDFSFCGIDGDDVAAERDFPLPDYDFDFDFEV